jgi:glycosyltransferase involved in cell wall biosynthesis
MKVSVITVCFNAANTIRHCLDSVAGQKYFDIEHIVIDGSSNDETMAIVKSYSHIAIAISEPDSGIYNAMNKGITHATGDLIIFINADDRFPTSETVELAIREIATLPLADMYYGSLEIRNADGSVNVFEPPSPDRAAELMVCGCLPHQATLTRKRVFETIGGFNERYRIHADYDWYLRVLADTRIKVRRVACIVGSYYTGGTSANLATGQPEVFEIQNGCDLYRSSDWDKKRIEIYQDQVLQLRLQNENLRQLLEAQTEGLRLAPQHKENVIVRIVSRLLR